VKRATDYAAWRASAPAAHGETLAPALTVTPDRFAGRLSEIEALAMLRTAGVPTVDYRRAATPQQALVEAAALGFPLAVKVDSPDIEHKTEIGGVRLDIGTPEALERAVEAILGNARKARPDADIRGVVLQPMMRPPLELIFGLVSDARFGAGVLVGLGGLLAEMLGRREVMLAPVTVNEAERAIARLFGGRTTGGVNFRGLDIGAAATALARFSVFATAAAPFVEAIDVNPVAVFRDGGGAVALDCLILPRRAEAP
jgi:succinyl-CoA synthetase beta subunit